MLNARKLTIFALLAIFTLSVGAVFAQQDDTPPDDRPPRGICRPDRQRGEREQHLAELLGLDIEAIHDYLDNGGSIEELAEQQGVDLEAARAARHAEKIAELEDCLAQAVADGEITQGQADEILEHAQTRFEQRVNGEFSPDGERPPRGRRGQGRGARGNGGNDGNGWFGGFGWFGSPADDQQASR